MEGPQWYPLFMISTARCLAFSTDTFISIQISFLRVYFSYRDSSLSSSVIMTATTFFPYSSDVRGAGPHPRAAGRCNVKHRLRFVIDSRAYRLNPFFPGLDDTRQFGSGQDTIVTAITGDTSGLPVLGSAPGGDKVRLADERS